MRCKLYSAALLVAFSAVCSRPCLAADAIAGCQTISGGQKEHFISDADYRSRVEAAYAERTKIIGTDFCSSEKLRDASAAEVEALRFLYAYMPLADATDYLVDFFLKNVRASEKAKREMPWGGQVPELLYRHFVLPVRVNNEALDSARWVFYKDLRQRVERLPMKDAILEVNHWCHEHVTYRPSDARTSSPLATIRTATGRCGEESTLLVAALRAVGIPARQVYTPRWAHTDDNHAWVEAWADGKWWFLGACEPEPVLNLGWFNAPASRAMLMHTRVFGDYQGPEEVLLRTPCNTEINLIANYADTQSLDFSVLDDKGRPVSGARVDFCIYNYAELCPVVTKYTAANGHVALSAGRGDMMVWASKGGKFGFAKASFASGGSVTVCLSHTANAKAKGETLRRDSFDIVPPPEKPRLPYVSAEQRAENNRRFEHEDSLRHAYTASFLTHDAALQALRQRGVDASEQDMERMAEYLVKSEGNHEVMLDFLYNHCFLGFPEENKLAFDMLATLSDKDLRDITPEILEDNVSPMSSLSPRVESEMITRPFKRFFLINVGERQIKAFRQDPERLVGWIKKNIRMNPDEASLMIAQTPVGAFEHRITDHRSRSILFVDMARSFGITARVDAVTQKTQYEKDGKWVDVYFDGRPAKAAPQGTLRLKYNGNGTIDDPKYFSHFTISRINADGTTTLLDYPSSAITWGNTFRQGIKLDAGQYILVSGTRLASGSVMAETQLFTVAENKETTVDMHLRTSPTEVSVIGSFNSETKIETLDGKEVSILSQTGRGYFCVGLIGVGQEPTNHALKDIAKVASRFDEWGRPLVLLFEDEAAARKFNAAEFPGLPKNIIWGIDRGGNVRREISANMKLTTPSLSPIFFISDTFNRVVFLRQGYTISLGEQMEQVLLSVE